MRVYLRILYNLHKNDCIFNFMVDLLFAISSYFQNDEKKEPA